jgi:hypothetical protein
MFPNEAGYSLRWDGHTCSDQRTSERRRQLVAAMGAQWREQHACRAARIQSALAGFTPSLEMIVDIERRREAALRRHARAGQ